MFFKMLKKKKIDKIRCSGATLIELMVVVVILSLVTLGLVSFFGGGVRAWISGQNQLKAQREARMAVDRMVKEIREANFIENGDSSSIEVNYPNALKGKHGDSVTYHLDTVNHRIMRNNNSILIDHIPADGFIITYYDADGNPTLDSSASSKIKIKLIVDVDNDDKHDITIETEVFLRNY